MKGAISINPRANPWALFGLILRDQFRRRISYLPQSGWEWLLVRRSRNNVRCYPQQACPYARAQRIRKRLRKARYAESRRRA